MSRQLVEFLPFEIKLTRVQPEPTSGGTRRLHTVRSWLDRTLWSTAPSTTNNSERHEEEVKLSRDGITKIPVDEESLTLIIQDYLKLYFRQKLNELPTTYAPLHAVSLASFDQRRERKLLGLEEEIGEDRLEMNGVFTSDPDEDYFNSWDVNTVVIQESNKAGGLRGRRTEEISTFTTNYQGVAAFDKNGSDPIPSATLIQGMQLSAFAIPDKLIQSLQSSAPQTGLDTVTDLAVKSITLNNNPGGGNSGGNSDDTSKSSKGLDSVIIIAITVASCSMFLLAFALYLAFKRRRQAEASGIKLHDQEDAISPKGTEGTGRSNGSPGTVHTPPVLEMDIHSSHDDNISAYTESVYSVAQNNSAEKNWASERTRSLTNVLKKSVDDDENDGAQDNGASNYFNPRYVGTDSLDGGEDDGQEEDDSIMRAIKSDNILGGDVGSRGDSETSEGLYPQSLIDDDINDALNAYPPSVNDEGISIDPTQRTNDDGISLSSAETYGFSLDGVGSTVANSTAYGY